VEPKASERTRALSQGRVWRKCNAKSRDDEQKLDMRCDVFEASGHVTIKPSIHNWDTFYKSSVYAMKVKYLTPGGLHNVEGSTEIEEIQFDRCAEVSRRHSRLFLATEGLNKSRRVIVGEVFLNGTC